MSADRAPAYPEHRRFLPYDKTVFRRGTWGALGLCIRCRQRAPTWMKEAMNSRRRIIGYVPFCERCKVRVEAAIKQSIANAR